MIRPSGTEPKLKAYFEVFVAVPDAAYLATAQATAQTRLETAACRDRGAAAGLTDRGRRVS